VGGLCSACANLVFSWLSACTTRTGVVEKTNMRDSSWLNVCDFGAVGDGQNDCTEAFRKALEAAAGRRGTVFVPDGVFVTGTVRLPPHTGLVGNATWGYREYGGSTLRLKDAAGPCLVDITGAVGATVNGLSLQGQDLGSGVHGIYMGANPGKKEEDTPRIERCHVSHFTGDGIRLDPVWCFSIRGCEVIFNKGNGLGIRGWDGFILDNWFSGNGGSGIASIGVTASNTLTGNRIEWNRGGGIRILGGGHYNITGNYIDRSGGPGLALLPGEGGGPCNCITVTGNVIYRSGKPEWTGGDEYESAHVRLEGGHGIVFVGNSLCVGQDDGGGVMSPRYSIVLRALKNAVVANNTMNIGSLKALVQDLGEHGEGVVIRDNVGNLFRDEGTTIWASGQI